MSGPCQIFAALAVAMLAGGVTAGGDGCRKVTFTPRDDAFRNPGQGWSAFGTNIAAWDKVVNLGAGYDRFQWNHLEPEEGKFNWQLIDRELDFFSKRGMPFAFRIMCANYHSAERDCTPRWVFEKGAEGYVFVGVPYALKDGTKTCDKVAPWFGDKIFIECHRRFIEALARRYDGDPRLHGIDLGSYGNWGEWHCYPLWPKSQGHGPSPSNPDSVRRQYVDMYVQNFHKTPIIFMTDDSPMLAYAEGKGTFRVGLRRDGVGDPKNIDWAGSKRYQATPQLGEVWKHKPVWFEWWGDGVSFGRKGSRFETWVVDRPIEWMLQNHVSLVNTIPFHPETFAKERPEEHKLLKALDLRAGARLVAQEAKLSVANGELLIRLRGRNDGVARIYLPYVASYSIVDESGREVSRQPSTFKPCAALPGEFTIVDKIKLPTAPSGRKLRLSLRLIHEPQVFQDFRWAVKDTTASGALDLGEI